MVSLTGEARAQCAGSGVIEFEELVYALRRQIRDEKAKAKEAKAAGVSAAAAAAEHRGNLKEGGTTMKDLFKVEVVEEDDGGAASMVLHEFVHALIRMAWECYPAPSAGIGHRLGALLERALLPSSAHLLDTRDPMEAELSSQRVQAITEYYAAQLLEVFRQFAAADAVQAVGSGAECLDTLSFAELVFMMKQAEMFDGNLTVAKLTEIFAQVNNQAADNGSKDDDADELSFSEFQSCLCRCANAKIPIDRRGTPPEPFEYTWHAFLQVIFLPKIKKVVKDMRKVGVRESGSVAITRLDFLLTWVHCCCAL